MHKQQNVPDWLQVHSPLKSPGLRSQTFSPPSCGMTHSLELVEGELAVLVAAVVLVDHLAHLPLRDLEADQVQRSLELGQVDVAVAIFVYLWGESEGS